MSVKDKLPDQVGFFIVAIDRRIHSRSNGVEIGECYKSVDTKGLFEVLKFHDYVTHWMPLPEPPEA